MKINEKLASTYADLKEKAAWAKDAAAKKISEEKREMMEVDVSSCI